MLYDLLYPLHTDISFFNIFRYITFRTIYGGLTAFTLCFLMGPWAIKKLSRLQIGQIIQKDGPRSHLEKEGTPTMGGLLILFSITISTLLWARLSNHYITITLLTLILFGLIGFIDDYLMQIKKRNMGFTARGKFMCQVVAALGISWLIYQCPDFTSNLTIPFFKNFSPDLGHLVYTLCRIDYRGYLQCRQSHRRPGWSGHRSLYYCGGILHAFCLCGGTH